MDIIHIANHSNFQSGVVVSLKWTRKLEWILERLTMCCWICFILIIIIELVGIGKIPFKNWKKKWKWKSNLKMEIKVHMKIGRKEHENKGNWGLDPEK